MLSARSGKGTCGMAYDVDYIENPGYLSVQISGKRSLQAVQVLTRELTQKAVALGYERILIDVRPFDGRLQTMESFKIVTEEFPLHRGQGVTRVAIVDRPLSEPEEWFFFETVARNRGFNLRIHTSPEPALAWLLEGYESTSGNPQDP